MLTVCIALSYCQITFFKVKHSCLKSVPSLSGSLPLHHKILQLGHYGCLLLVYFCAGYLGTSPCLWFIWFIPNFTSENSNDQGRIFFFLLFTLTSLQHNLQFSSNLIQKEMQNMPITKLPQPGKVCPIWQEERGLICIKLG